MILEATENADLKPASDIYIALDVAASELFEDGKYNLYSENKNLDSVSMVEYLGGLISKYPIISVEDGLDENDWTGWTHFNKQFGEKIQIVGDDLTVTNIKRLDRAINERSMNAILVKLNQIGTVSGTIKTVNRARRQGLVQSYLIDQVKQKIQPSQIYQLLWVWAR